LNSLGKRDDILHLARFVDVVLRALGHVFCTRAIENTFDGSIMVFDVRIANGLRV
jgi:hypothetical protein